MGIGLVFAVLASGWCCIHNFLYTIGSDAQTDGAVAGAIEPIAVVGFVWHEVQGCAIIINYFHKQCPFRGMLSPKGDAKVERKY